MHLVAALKLPGFDRKTAHFAGKVTHDTRRGASTPERPPHAFLENRGMSVRGRCNQRMSGLNRLADEQVAPHGRRAGVDI
jgi:hypothetical protein